jgi:hypothetical protein
MGTLIHPRFFRVKQIDSSHTWETVSLIRTDWDLWPSYLPARYVEHAWIRVTRARDQSRMDASKGWLERSLAVRPPARIIGKFLASTFFDRIPENVENPNRCINIGVSDWYERAMLTWDLMPPP